MFPVRPLARKDSWNIHKMQCPEDTLHSSLGYNERTNSLWFPPREYFLTLTLSVNDTSKDLIFWCSFITFVNIVNYGVGDVFVHSMKVYRGSITISALDCSKWSNSWPAPAVVAHGKIPGTHSLGGWVGPRNDLGGFGEEDVSYPCRDTSPNLPARRDSLQQLRLPKPIRYSVVYCCIHPPPPNCTMRSFSIVKGTQYLEEVILKLAGYSNDRNIPRFIKLKKWT
jgi:hypothetical protein